MCVKDKWLMSLTFFLHCAFSRFATSVFQISNPVIITKI